MVHLRKARIPKRAAKSKNSVSATMATTAANAARSKAGAHHTRATTAGISTQTVRMRARMLRALPWERRGGEMRFPAFFYAFGISRPRRAETAITALALLEVDQ